MSLHSLLNQTITVYPKTAYDAQGREVIGAPVLVKARFQPKQKTIMSPTGALVTIDAMCYVMPEEDIAIDYKVTYAGQTYKVYGKYPVADGAGITNHLQIQLIRWQT